MSQIEAALIICTKDRPIELRRILQRIESIGPNLNVILIVDSSSDSESFKVTKEAAKSKKLDYRYIHCEPGLPYQRNAGILHLERSLSKVSAVFFLDDDANIDDKYFEVAMNYLKETPQWVAFTGVSTDLSICQYKKFKEIFFLHSEKKGRILPSGETTIVSSDIENLEQIIEVDWLPGISMVINFDLVVKEKFRDDIRMYYEDVELSLRLKKYGKLIALRNMNYSHLKSELGRDSSSEQITYTLGMRWELSRYRNSPIKRSAIIWSMIGLSSIAIVNLLRKAKRKPALSTLEGEFIFIRNLIFRLPIIQARDYS